jgi:hypothetical protein
MSTIIYGIIAILLGILSYIFGPRNSDVVKSGSSEPIYKSSDVLTYAQAMSLDYPYRKYFASIEDLEHAMNAIRNAKLEVRELDFNIPMLQLDKSEQTFEFHDTRTQWVIDDPSDDFNTVGFVSDYFNQECRVQCKRYNEKLTPIEYWQQNKRKVLSLCEKWYRVLTWHNLEETMYRLCKGCTTFRPKLLSAFINEYKPESILDISSGWGDRLAAAIATKTTYLGCDPNSCLHPGYKSMIKQLGNNDKTKYQVLHDKFQDCKIPTGRMFDMVFTSPPYFDVEVYSHEDTQSISEFTSVDAWFTGFLAPSLDKAWSHLNPNGLLVLHINNTPGKPDYVVRMRDYINKFADAKYMGILGKVTNGEGSKARPIWIWRKLGVKKGNDEQINPEESIIETVEEIDEITEIYSNEPVVNLNNDHKLLKTEYEGYLKSEKIRERVSKIHPKARPKLEQLIERWFLININETKSHLKFCDLADDMFIETCREKYIMKPIEAEKFLDAMKDDLTKHIPINNIDLTVHTTDIEGPYGKITRFKVANYEFELTYDRVDALRKHAIANGLPADKVNDQIMACALRYAAIFAYGRQWCAGLNVYEDAAAAGATVEGMASPFNAQILRIQGIQNPKFCSLFPDIEGPLGSIGSFFDCDFDNSHVVVNPPRVEEVIERVVEFCIDQVSSRKCTFTMILPLWTDAHYYITLKSTEGTLIEELDMEKYYSEDPFSGEIKKAIGFKFMKVTLNSM